MKAFRLIIIISVLAVSGFARKIPADSLYLGQKPPDSVPVIFAPGIICLDNRFEGCAAFSSDGKMFFFTVTNEYGPFLSPDSKYLFFIRHDGIKGDIYWVNAGIIKKLRKT